jgi:hypothetical protein
VNYKKPKNFGKTKLVSNKLIERKENMSEEKNVKIRFVDAWKDYIRQNNTEPTQVRFSLYTASDFCKISNELGSLGDKLFSKGIDGLNGENMLGLKVTIDKKRPEHTEPEFQFS